MANFATLMLGARVRTRAESGSIEGTVVNVYMNAMYANAMTYTILKDDGTLLDVSHGSIERAALPSGPPPAAASANNARAPKNKPGPSFPTKDSPEAGDDVPTTTAPSAPDLEKLAASLPGK